MTTALEGGEESASRPGRSLPPEKNPVPIVQEAGWAQGLFGQVRKISPPPGFDPRTVQLVANRCTDYASQPTCIHIKYPLFLLSTRYSCPMLMKTELFWTDFSKNALM